MSKNGTTAANIPEALIYEMDEGKPIYYRDYREVLNGTKTPEQVMGSGILQSLLIELIKDYLKPLFGKDYVLLSNEIGIQFGKKSWRNADIAGFKKEDLLESEITDKYSDFPPVLVIEIDTKAALENLTHPEEYYHRKTDQLLDFGVQQVLWIFTSTKKFMIAEKDKRWETGNWTEDLALRSDINLNIQQLLDEFVES
jgi:Uma2 family endonuclease